MSEFMSASRRPSRLFRRSGWAVSIAGHVALFALMVFAGRAAALESQLHRTRSFFAAPEQSRDQQRKTLKKVIEVRKRRLQVARVRDSVIAQLRQAAPRDRAVAALPARAPAAPPPPPIAARLSPDEAIRESRADLMQSVRDYESIRAAKLVLDGGLPLKEAQQLAATDPLAGQARAAAQAEDLEQILESIRNLAGAAHHLPDGPTGVTVAVDNRIALPGAQETQTGDARDLTGDPDAKPIAGSVPASPAPASPLFTNIQPVAGRTIAQGGEPAEWMYVDSWYCVGPFPNPNRSNIDTAFPPETEVNLDAAYTGKDGRIVTWEFLQSPTVNVVPLHAEEYAIWYLYSEVRLDRPEDLWIAIGSDDASKVWVNGAKVWQSSDVLKGWRVDEGFRKVHFNQGVNRILARLENGWRGTAISLAIRVKQP